MKTAELEGAALDYYVAQAGKEWENAHQYFPTMTLDPTFKGVTIGMFPRGEYGAMVETCILIPRNEFRQEPQPFCPSIWWQQGGPILEREKITVHDDDVLPWRADHIDNNRWYFGDTYLIAAMRAFVASKFGDEVPDIKEAS